jgi:hypothetical protein
VGGTARRRASRSPPPRHALDVPIERWPGGPRFEPCQRLEQETLRAVPTARTALRAVPTSVEPCQRLEASTRRAVPTARTGNTWPGASTPGRRQAFSRHAYPQRVSEPRQARARGACTSRGSSRCSSDAGATGEPPAARSASTSARCCASGWSVHGSRRRTPRAPDASNGLRRSGVPAGLTSRKREPRSNKKQFAGRGVERLDAPRSTGDEG